MELTLDYKPFPKQSEIHKAIEDPSIKFIAVNGSRQAGKTKLMMMSIVKQAFNDPKCRSIIVVSPTDNQSKRIYDIMNRGLETGHLLKTKSSKPGDYTLKLVNGSKILFKSAKQQDNIRGQNCDFMVLDESAFISSEVVYTILMPMIVTKPHAKMLCVSTPNSRNWFYDFYTTCGKSTKDSRAFFLSWKDNPLVSEDIIDKFRETLPEHIFNREFMGSFSDNGSVFPNITKNTIQLKDIIPFNGVFAGIDVGMKNDFTVVSIVTDKGQMIDMLRITNLLVDDMLFEINKFLKQYNVKRIMIEDNSMGIVIFQLLKKVWHNKIVPFNTNSKTKPEIVTELITAFSQNRIKIIENRDLISELEDFEYQIVKETGRVRYQARSNHDDCVMSLCIAWRNYQRRYTIDGVPLRII